VAEVSTVTISSPLVEAQDLVLDAEGDTYLVASTATPVSAIELSPPDFRAAPRPVG
jgi:hypothetical protein